jgi:hypothetical protein
MEIWNKGDFMGKPENCMRFSLDIPYEQHMHLKMLATRKGISMRAYILETLALREAAEDVNIDLENESFHKGLKRVLKKHDTLIRNLSKR